jgi:Tfp pilus assembly protein PilF
MLINLGVVEMNERHLERAKAVFQRVLEKTPEQPFALVNLATVALKQNDFTVARELLGRAEKHPVTAARARDISAVVEYRQSGTLDLPLLRLASRTGAPSWTITERYIRALAESGRMPAAVIELRNVLATEWYRADSWQLMGDCLTKLGRQTEAALAFINAERYDVHLHAH